MYIRLHPHTSGCLACTQRFLCFLQALVCKGSPERAWKSGGWNRDYATLQLYIGRVPSHKYKEVWTYIQTSIHACMYAYYIHTYIYTYIHWHTDRQADRHTYGQTYRHTDWHTNIPTYRRTVRRYVGTCVVGTYVIGTYVHTYIRIYILPVPV